MPVVPYTSVPTVQPLPMPRLRREPQLPPNAPSEAFGGGVASQAGGIGDLSGAQRAFEGIAAEEQRIRLEQRAKADQVAVTDAGGQLATYRNHALWDPNEGALTRQGVDAFSMPEKARDEFWNVSNVIRDSLTSDDQRAAYDKIAASEWSGMDEQIQRHVAGEIQKHDDQTSQAVLDAKQQQAVLAYSDPHVVEPAIVARAETIRLNGQRKGLDDATIADRIANATSQTRFDVFQQFLNHGQDLTAAQYFNDHRDQFVGRDLLEAERLADAGSVRGTSQRAADDIVQRTTTLGDSMKAAAQLADPRVRDATEQRVRRYYEDQAADLREQRAQAFQQAGQILEQTGDLDKVPLSLRTKLSTEENAALARREDQIRHPRSRTDWDLYASLQNMAALSETTRAQFKDLDLTQYRGRLADSEFRTLVTLQRSLRQRDLTAADAAKKKADAQAQHDANVARIMNPAFLDSLKHGTATFAPRPPQAPGAPMRVTPDNVVGPNGQKLPQSWLDHAARDSSYRRYLRGLGYPVP